MGEIEYFVGSRGQSEKDDDQWEELIAWVDDVAFGEKVG